MSGSKKDMRRPDLVIPYGAEPVNEKSGQGDMSSAISTTLPMAAIFTKNKMIGWSSLIFATNTWLAEAPDKPQKPASPGLLAVAMALMSIVVNYMPLFLPPPPGKLRATGTGTEAPGAVPLR